MSPESPTDVSPTAPSAALAAGMVIEVTQQIPQRDEVWTTTVRGTVVRFRQARTGSWYAHSRGDRLWLDRVVLRLDDGELTELTLDRYSRVEIIDDSAAEPVDLPDHLGAEVRGTPRDNVTPGYSATRKP